jgi:hypothetical protein
MRVAIATLLLFFGVQGTPTDQTGRIEGRAFRASNSEAISGVQISLLLPTPQAAGTPQAAPIAPTQMQLSQTPQGIQVTMTVAGNTTTQTLPADGLAALQRSGAPLTPEAIASFLRTGTVPNTLTSATDSDGRFSFPNLAPGVYTLRAQRQGYFGPRSPQDQYPTVITQSVTVEANKTAKVDIGMVQAGVLRGLLRDPDGQPAANYAVVTARPGYTNLGRAVWLLTGAMNADDRGEYRWPGFPPGEFYVGAGPRAPGPIANVQDSWARVFAPGVIDPNQARAVTIPEGGEVTVNLSAQVKPWGSFKISGVAINPLPNLVPDPTTGVINRAATAIVLMPLDLTPLDNPPTTSWTNLVATNTKPNGEFVLSNVDPGRYELYAMAADAQNRRVWTGHVHVEVRDKDLTGLNIPIAPGVTLQGQVSLTGSGTTRPDTVRINLQSLDTLPPQVGSAVGAVPVDENGRFEIANLSEGRYRINVGVPPPAYVVSVQQGGMNIYDEGFTLDTQSAQVPIRVEISMSSETVEGNVRISPVKVASNAMVVLVPAASHRGNPNFYKTAVSDNQGHFLIRGVAPGEYTAFAWEAVYPGAYQNPDFLAKYQSRGRALNVQPQGRSDIELDLIPAN